MGVLTDPFLGHVKVSVTELWAMPRNLPRQQKIVFNNGVAQFVNRTPLIEMVF